MLAGWLYIDLHISDAATLDLPRGKHGFLSGSNALSMSQVRMHVHSFTYLLMLHPSIHLSISLSKINAGSLGLERCYTVVPF